MSALFNNLIIGVSVLVFVLYATECQVTVTNESGHFLCGKSVKLKCTIEGYIGGMSWKLNGTIIAQCAFGSCTALGALPSGDNFTYDESAGNFYLEIGITHADNGTIYQCDDGSTQDHITVNIQVTPTESSDINVTVTNDVLTCDAGCFYPPTDGMMNVYCVTNGIEALITSKLSLTPSTSCGTGDCAGPNIVRATGNTAVNSSVGTSLYRTYVYLRGLRNYRISIDTPAIYICDPNLRSSSTSLQLCWISSILILVCGVIAGLNVT